MDNKNNILRGEYGSNFNENHIQKNNKKLKDFSANGKLYEIKEHEVFFYPPEIEGFIRVPSVVIFQNVIFSSVDYGKDEVKKLLEEEIIEHLIRSFKKNEKINVSDFIREFNAKHKDKVVINSIKSIDICLFNFLEHKQYSVYDLNDSEYPRKENLNLHTIYTITTKKEDKKDVVDFPNKYYENDNSQNLGL